MVKSTIRKFHEAIMECITVKQTIDYEMEKGIRTPVEAEAAKIAAEADFRRKSDDIWAECPQIPPQPGDEELVRHMYKTIGMDVKIPEGGFK